MIPFTKLAIGRISSSAPSLLIVLGLLLIPTRAAIAQDTSIKLEVMASRTSLPQSPGHALMCISIPLNSGVKEDCYGFYPLRNGFGRVFGPGIIENELANERPRRFRTISASYKEAISESQRLNVLNLMREWNTKNYILTNQNCINFVDSVAKRLGWRTPEGEDPGTRYNVPETYVKMLEAVNTDIATGVVSSASISFGSGICNGCNYETTLNNIRMRIKFTRGMKRIINTQVTCRAVERGLNCPHAPIPPHEWKYDRIGSNIDGDSIIIRYGPERSNNPRCSLVFRGKISRNSISGTLTWSRDDGTPQACHYTINAPITLRVG